MSAPVPRHDPEARTDEVLAVHGTSEQPTEGLRTGVSVTTGGDGTFVATVHLHGQLCAATAPLLQTELDRLVEDGVAALCIDLHGLELCTSDGIDLFQDNHRRLQMRHGALRLAGARGVVRQVLDIVDHADPAFTPVLVDGADGSPA